VRVKGLTGSGVERAMHCAAAAVLPQSDVATEWSGEGDVNHAFLENCARYGRERALAMAPKEHRAALERIDLDALPPLQNPGAFRFEAAFAYNLVTGVSRFLGTGIHRRYDQVPSPPTEDEVALTLDVAGQTQDEAVVADWKSFFGRNVTPAAHNWQLKLGALAVTRNSHLERATVAAVLLRDGDPYWDVATLSELDLDAAESALRGLKARIDALRERGVEVQDTHQGPWCRYCPALASCPAKKAMLSAALDKELIDGALNERNARLVYERLVAIDTIRDLMWKTLDEYAEVTPIDLGDGNMYGKREKQRTSIVNVKAALTLLEREHGIDVSEAVELSLTNAAVKDAIAAKHAREGIKRQLTKTYEAAMAALSEAGAAKTATFYSVEKHRRPKELPAPTPTEAPQESHAPEDR
jgi:hypothetical protein